MTRRVQSMSDTNTVTVSMAVAAMLAASAWALSGGLAQAQQAESGVAAPSQPAEAGASSSDKSKPGAASSGEGANEAQRPRFNQQGPGCRGHNRDLELLV